MRTSFLSEEQRSPSLTNITHVIDCLSMLLSLHHAFIFSTHTELLCSDHGAWSPPPRGNTLLGGTVHYRASFTTYETHFSGDD